jgi:pimeloyl-ACP methyl ester carboxylesterase
MSSLVPIILLVGGLGMQSTTEFQTIQSELERRGARVLVFDNLNVGSGPRVPLETLTIQLQAEHQWRRVQEALGDTPHLDAIFGISMGGMIAAQMAALHPDWLDQLILAATSPNLTGTPAIADPIFAAWAAVRTPEDFTAATRIAFGATTLAERPSVMTNYIAYRLRNGNNQKPKEFMGQLDSIRRFHGEAIYRALETIGERITVISADEDTLFPEPQSTQIVTLLGDKPKRIRVPKAGHSMHLECPDAIINAIWTSVTQ